MANYQEYMHPYSKPGLASNPPVLDASAYPNSALKSPYPVQSKRNPLATANFPLLKKLAATCLNLTEVFEPVRILFRDAEIVLKYPNRRSVAGRLLISCSSILDGSTRRK